MQTGGSMEITGVLFNLVVGRVAILVRIFLTWWLLFLAVALILIARGDEKRMQNYNACDAQAASAFSHDNLSDLEAAVPQQHTREWAAKLQDDIRRTCMLGKGYVVSGSKQCAVSLFTPDGPSITFAECFHRSIYATVAAQVK